MGFMTNEQHEHIGKIVLDFSRKANEKYEKGVIEHGGNLWEHETLWLVEQAMDEAIDQYVYLYTLREKIRGIPSRD